MALFSQTIISLLVLLPLLVSSQNNGSVPLGSSLTSSDAQEPSNSWRSPSGDFAFGFREIEPSKGSVLAIWFDKIPDKTIVWYAFVEGGVVPQGSKVTLTADRGLVLTNPQGNELWRSGVSTGSVSRGFMNATGNLVLLNDDSEDLWSSFADPRDTLLPTQIMEVRGVVSSRRSETNFTKGRFQLRLLRDGNLVLNTLNADTLSDTDEYRAYYHSLTFDPQNESNSGLRLIFNQSGYMYILRRNGATSGLTSGIPASSSDFYHRVILHFDGVLAQYYYPREQSSGDARSWSMAWSKPDNICDKDVEFGTQACGYNNVCTLGENRRPKCKCPPEFSLMEPDDEHGNCKPDFEMYGCGSDGVENRNATAADLYEFIRLQDTDWPTDDFEEYGNYDEERCRGACLRDCLCTVVIFRQGTCWKKKFPLSHGRRSVDVNGLAFIKVPQRRNSSSRDSYSPGAVEKEDRDSLIITGSVLLGTSAFVNFILIPFFIVTLVSLYHKKRSSRNAGSDAGAVDSNLRVFTYKELEEATGEFNEELGRGANGIRI